jgi:hypothetical protein
METFFLIFFVAPPEIPYAINGGMAYHQYILSSLVLNNTATAGASTDINS